MVRGERKRHILAFKRKNKVRQCCAHKHRHTWPRGDCESSDSYIVVAVSRPGLMLPQSPETAHTETLKLPVCLFPHHRLAKQQDPPPLPRIRSLSTPGELWSDGQEKGVWEGFGNFKLCVRVWWTHRLKARGMVRVRWGQRPVSISTVLLFVGYRHTQSNTHIHTKTTGLNINIFTSSYWHIKCIRYKKCLSLQKSEVELSPDTPSWDLSAHCFDCFTALRGSLWVSI